MPLNPQLLEILRCPNCLNELHYSGHALTCRNAECRRSYAIKNDIPYMLIDEAEILEPQAWQERLAEISPSA